MGLSTLADRLACPRCDSALQNLQCPGCQIEFPVIDGVPWLVADPPAVLSQWRNRWHMALAQLESQSKAARRALAATSSIAAQTRLRTLSEGCANQHKALSQLLAPLGLGQPADLETYLALKTRLPTQLGLMSYQANVHRDWCWGDAENSQALAGVARALADKKPQRLLVLGAGAGRLAYDLHESLAPELTVALDINPYLTNIAHKMASGESVSLTEFPLAPSSGAQCAIERTLCAPCAAQPGFQVVLADALRAPFKPDAFDLVITPWLIDVVDVPPGLLLPGFNQLLEDGGTWLLHGSLAFTRQNPAECLNLAEIQELTEEHGFRIHDVSETIQPYLDCPDSRHGRRESVVTLAAIKTTSVVQPDRQQNLPDWIAKGRSPVPLLPAFQTQATTTRIHAFIMTLIDGKRSLKNMSEVLEQQQLMPREDAETAIRGFLIKMLEEAGSQGL